MDRRSLKLIGTVGVVAVAGFAFAMYLRSRETGSEEPDTEYPYRDEVVDLYIEESFPASDSPGFAPTTHIGGVN
jgi:hypothetical protein